MIGTHRISWRWARQQGVVALLLVLAFAGSGIVNVGAWAGQSAVSESVQVDPQRLAGRWVRPDGGYVLELGEVVKGGRLKAAYFNPRPINVAKAEWQRKDGALTVFVELRDVNYPGSTYTLRYDPVSDRLTGTYFQAVEKRSFAIEFGRSR